MMFIFCCYISPPFQKSMRDALKAPEVIPTDFGKFEEPFQHHMCNLALSEFHRTHSRLPVPYNSADNAAFLGLCKQSNEHFSLGLEVSLLPVIDWELSPTWGRILAGAKELFLVGVLF